MFKKLSKKKGFTLMEMMIVVAIIAILIAIIIPTFSGALARAHAAADEANLRAYYAEQMADAILEDRAPTAPTDTTSVTVSGVTYKLYGTAKYNVNTAKKQMTIEYPGPDGSGVSTTIPGGGNTGTKTSSGSNP